MSRSSFCSFFKRETGQTFTEYLNEKRIEPACELLENKEMNINEVGQAVGIPDILRQMIAIAHSQHVDNPHFKVTIPHLD